LDDDGAPYGSDDFVIGYSQVFIYEALRNKNPLVEGLQVAGEGLDVCIGPSCSDAPDQPAEDCEDGVACLDLCTKDDEDDCDEVDIKAIIPQFLPCEGDDCSPVPNAEGDEIARVSYGRDQDEQMWVRYYTTKGRIGSEVKLLNDALTGWNPDHGTELRIPNEPGPITIWAVASDNRGGQDWVRAHAFVR
jgi:hypothetical protein